jgi:hypothetical protein
MRNLGVLFLAPLALAALASADVSITDRLQHRDLMRQQNIEKNKKGRRAHQQGTTAGLSARALATGSVALIDANGLEYFIDTDITFSTTSSASGAASEANFTAAVAATTLNGGTVASTLNDAFDGYNTLCLWVAGTPYDRSPCETGNANWAIYNFNGPSTGEDDPVAGPPITTECGGRQVVFNPQTIGNIDVSRKVYVPADDDFARWLNIFTNTGSGVETVTMVTNNNLGSDSNTKIVSSSDGDRGAATTDTWVSTFEDYSGTTSGDPRLGHVLRGPAADVPLTYIHFADDDDNPYWAYTFNLDPGETKIIMNFVTGQPSKAAANAKAAELARLDSRRATDCMSGNEMLQTVNFRATQLPIPALSSWGRALLLVLLLAAGALVLRRVM